MQRCNIKIIDCFVLPRTLAAYQNDTRELHRPIFHLILEADLTGVHLLRALGALIIYLGPINSAAEASV